MRAESYFNQYISDLPLHEFHKDSLLIKEPLGKAEYVYLTYPELFAAVFPVEPESMRLLSISGYLHYLYLIGVDRILDEGKIVDIESFSVLEICKEESSKILSRLFNPGSPFWACWNHRRAEYIVANKFDGKEPDLSKFEQLSDGKSAYGKVAIDALYYLTSEGAETPYRDLLHSHRLFSIALQLKDDFFDLEEDLENGQYNYVLSRLEGAASDTSSAPDPKEQVKAWASSGRLRPLLYESGVAVDVLSLARRYLVRACEKTGRFKKLKWNALIQRELLVINSMLFHTQNFVEIQENKKSQSNRRQSIGRQPLHSALQSGLKRAGAYITSRQQEDGSWRDYITQAGIGATWTTGFVLAGLTGCETDGMNGALEKGRNYLHRVKSNLWGYNEQWINDADTTNFCLLALSGSAIDQADLSGWSRYQTPAGGLATYCHGDELTALLGLSGSERNNWLEPHPCVSAVACLAAARLQPDSSFFSGLMKYLTDVFKEKETEKAYWWTNDLYTASFFLQACLTAKHVSMIEHLADICADGIQAILGSAEPTANLFYISLATSALLKDNSLFLPFREVLEESILLISKTQFDDGSWKATSGLRIPHPSLSLADIRQLPFPVKHYGYNVRSEEFNRLFTTVACYGALHAYLDMKRKKEKGSLSVEAY